MDFPVMPLYVRDWSFDVAHLSLEERGAYITLLTAMWGRGGRLAHDEHALSILLSIDQAYANKLLRALTNAAEPLLVVEGGYLVQKRLRRELEEMAQRRTRASKGARARWENTRHGLEHGIEHPLSINQASGEADAQTMPYPSTQHLKETHVPTSDRSVDKRVDNSVPTDAPTAAQRGPKPTLQPSTDDIVLADHLGHLIVANNPSATPPTEAQTMKWADAIRLLHQKDGHSHAEIRSVIDWSQADEWWRARILSADKLREQWNQLTARMQAEGQKKRTRLVPVRGMTPASDASVATCQRCMGAGTVFVPGSGVQPCPDCKTAGAVSAAEA